MKSLRLPRILLVVILAMLAVLAGPPPGRAEPAPQPESPGARNLPPWWRTGRASRSRSRSLSPPPRSSPAAPPPAGIVPGGRVEAPLLDGLRCYLGVTHAHSSLSPDFEPAPMSAGELSKLVASRSRARFEIPGGPYEAWQHAARHGGIDFLVLSDHVHGPEGRKTDCHHEMPPGGYRLLRDAARRIRADGELGGRFLPIPAMEWSTLEDGNHVNIMFARREVPAGIANGDYRELLEGYLRHPGKEGKNPQLLVQMNHPNANDYDRNYGRRQYRDRGGVKAYASAFRDVYFGIEHINAHDDGTGSAREANDHRNGNHLGRFYRHYLNLGFRIGPTAGHDNHRANWGRHTAARTGVWARSLSVDDFVEACRARRLFASEDKDLVVALRCGDAWMGSEVPVAAGGQERTFTVHVDQRPDRLTGEPLDEGPYLVQIMGDPGGPGGPPAREVKVRQDDETRSVVEVPQGGSATFKLRVAPGSYYYAHVREAIDRDPRTPGADAWTAPIWFVEPRSRRSSRPRPRRRP